MPEIRNGGGGGTGVTPEIKNGGGGESVTQSSFVAYPQDTHTAFIDPYLSPLPPMEVMPSFFRD